MWVIFFFVFKTLVTRPIRVREKTSLHYLTLKNEYVTGRNRLNQFKRPKARILIYKCYSIIFIQIGKIPEVKTKQKLIILKIFKDIIIILLLKIPNTRVRRRSFCYKTSMIEFRYYDIKDETIVKLYSKYI